MPEPDTGGAEYPALIRDVVAGLPADRTDARTVWRALGRAGAVRGLYAAGDPAAVLPGRLTDLLHILDEHLPLGVVLSVCVQAATVVPLLAGDARAGSGAAAHDAMLDGTTMIALAVTDTAGPGSDVVGGLTELIAEAPGKHRLTGTKKWITNALHADRALVLARHRPARHFTSFRWVLAPLAGAGVEPASDLFAGAGIGHIRFDHVRVGDDDLVGAPGRGLSSFARQIGVERFAGAVWAQSLCRRVLRDTLTTLRHDRGATALWADASIRARFAQCVVELRRMQAMTAGIPPTPATAMVLKAAIAQGADHILGECLRLAGADAFRPGGVAQLRTEAAMFGIAGGAEGAMLAGVAGHADELLADDR